MVCFARNATLDEFEPEAELPSMACAPRSESPAAGEPFTFSGRHFERGELYYFHVRCFDPSGGRFIDDVPIACVAGDAELFPYPAAQSDRP
jgi:hypothetical protein